MKFITEGYYWVDDVLKEPSFNVGSIISISSPLHNNYLKGKQPEPSKLNEYNHLRLLFHDIEKKSKGYHLLPKRKHIEQIIEFYETIDKSKNILSHCHFGVSRSSAVSILLALLYNNKNVDNAIEMVMEYTDRIYPNQLMIEYIDNILCLKSELIRKILFLKEKVLYYNLKGWFFL